MANKKPITYNEIEKLDHEVLAKLVQEQMLENDRLYGRVEKLLLKNDQGALVQRINKDISSIRRGRKFIDYYDSFKFAQKIDDIVETIDTMVKDPKAAARLYKDLILTDSKVYLRSDDSAGAIQTGYRRAEDGWKASLGALSKEEIYKDLKDLLISEGFGVRSVFCEAIPASVLQRIYEEFYDKSKAMSAQVHKSFESFSDFTVLKECAHYLKDPRLAIEAHRLFRRLEQPHDLLDIAKEFRHIDDPSGTLAWLKKIEKVPLNMIDDYYRLQIWAFDRLERKPEVTLTYKEWYEAGSSPQVFKAYLDRLDGVMKEKERKTALEKANRLSFSQAIDFFYQLDEKELAAAYILKNRNKLETQYLYGKHLNELVSWLEKSHPDAAILLLRDAAEKMLATAQSKNYPWVIRYLKRSLEIEKGSPAYPHQMVSSDEYFENLLQVHDKKRKFMELFHEAFK